MAGPVRRWPAMPAAVRQYVTAGGGYVGGHAAAETEPGWTFYRGLVGTGHSESSCANGSLRLDAPNFRPVGGGTLDATAGNNAWASRSVAVSVAAGSHKLFPVFRGVTGGPTSGLATLNWVAFAPASP
jgi:hypothetical protein